tara:strand:- start:241 stop:375 length:135 start_codon:yes stop_codon:yes gene_type:complete
MSVETRIVPPAFIFYSGVRGVISTMGKVYRFSKNGGSSGWFYDL